MTREERSKTVIIAGCTRSGLSLTMQLLDKGGFPCFGSYPAYEDYEWGKIDYKQNEGKAIKVVDTDNQLPPTGNYHVIRLHRDFEEQTKSMIKWIETFSPVSYISDKEGLKALMKQQLEESYKKIDQWANKQEKVLHIHFETLIKSPEKVIEDLYTCFGIKLKKEAVNCIKERSTDCYNGFLELELLNNE